MSNREGKRVEVYLTEHAWTQAQTWSRTLGITMSDYLRMAVDHLNLAQAGQTPPQTGLEHALAAIDSRLDRIETLARTQTDTITHSLTTFTRILTDPYTDSPEPHN